MKHQPIWSSIHSGIYVKRTADKKSVEEAKKVVESHQLSGYDIALILRSFIERAHDKEKAQSIAKIIVSGLLIANLIAIGILLVR